MANAKLHREILNNYLSEFEETIAKHHEQRFGRKRENKSRDDIESSLLLTC